VPAGSAALVDADTVAAAEAAAADSSDAAQVRLEPSVVAVRIPAPSVAPAHALQTPSAAAAAAAAAAAVVDVAAAGASPKAAAAYTTRRGRDEIMPAAIIGCHSTQRQISKCRRARRDSASAIMKPRLARYRISFTSNANEFLLITVIPLTVSSSS
jgi:hypothetical protein